MDGDYKSIHKGWSEILLSVFFAYSS